MATHFGPKDDSPLRILLVEDNSDDAELCSHALKKAHKDISINVVRTEDEFANELQANDYDVILSDYSLGGWTG